MAYKPKTQMGQWPGRLLTAATLLFCAIASPAQTVSDEEVKAAYIYNFGKFVEWPAQTFESSSAPLRLCLFRKDGLEPNLRKVVNGKSIGNHAVSVVAVEEESEYRACHILFVGAAQAAQSKRILNALRGASILTVGDTEDFAKEGGIIQFVLDNDRVQFRVNHRAAEQAQLVVSSRLLRVAKAVIE